MRRFSSYGPLDTDLHFYAPRQDLIDHAHTLLLGDRPAKGGHYITVWAPRQTGKTWIMQQILRRVKSDPSFNILKINLETLKNKKKVSDVINAIAKEIGEGIGKTFNEINDENSFQQIFKKDVLEKPLILILDEFDALVEPAINAIVSTLRNIYIHRMDEVDITAAKKTYLLHGVALVGVRSVLGIENQKGSPFNIQHSVNIPNLSFDEVKGMFKWYEKDSGRKINEDVIHTLFHEVKGQPGLTCWFGELLTETYKKDDQRQISMQDFNYAYKEATDVLPNNNILNIISKAKQEPYRGQVLKLFNTDKKIEFRFDDEELNFLYMNGVIDIERELGERNELNIYCKFASPYVQGRLFNYFSREIFGDLGLLIHPLDSMDDAINDDELHIPKIIKRYKAYLEKNRDIIFKDVPRRKSDLKIYEAVYHFSLYRYLYDLLKKRGVEVIPEFPTGNGKIDLLLRYHEKLYAIELKSFRDMYDFRKGVEQATQYGHQLGLSEIVYLVFVELKQEELTDLEQEIESSGVKVIVLPVGVL